MVGARLAISVLPDDVWVVRGKAETAHLVGHYLIDSPGYFLVGCCLGMSFVVIGMNLGQVGPALAAIFDGAFSADGVAGVGLTAASFQATFDWFRYPLALAVLMFAVSTMISWSYYGLKGWTYLFGEGATNEMIYKIMFCVFVVIGCSIGFSAVIDFSDAAIFAMGIFNIIGLYFLMPVVKEELNKFLAKVESGEFKRYR